jgi:phage terminase large subunit-like protein
MAAGEDTDTWCCSQHEIYERMLRGTIKDYRFSDERLVYIIMVDDGDDLADEAVWINANPNPSISVHYHTGKTVEAEFVSCMRKLLA